MADNLNIKNPSVTEGELDLRTDASGNIVSISGHSIAGGAGGGNVYFGDDEYIKFKTGTTNTFTLTDGVKDVIEHIPQTVETEVNRISYTKDSIDDKLDEKQNKLTFEYDEDNKVSAINGSALAGQGGTTYTPGQYINIDSNNEISVTGLVAIDEYATYSGDWNDVSNSYKTNSGSFITKDVNNLTNYYPKTQTSSDSELAEAFGSILKYDVTAAAGIKITTATDVGIKTFGISMTAEPVVTDTRLSGYNGIAAEPDGNVSGLWDVGLTQDMLNKINGKLDTTAAAQTYLEKSTYTNASSKWENASNVVVTNSANWNAKVDPGVLDDYLTKTQYGTDSATFALKNDLYDYYPKTDTSSKTQLSDEFDKCIQTISTGVGLSGDGKTTPLGIDTTASINLTNASAKSAASADKANSATNAYSATWATKAMGSHTEYTLGSTLDTMSNITATIDATLESITGYNGIERQIDETTHYATAFGLTNSAYAAVQYVTANSGNWDKVSDKLDTTAAAQTYQTKGDYVKNTDIGLDANKVTAISGKELIITAHQSLTNYYTKSETSGATEISTALGNKVDKPSSLIDKYLVLRTNDAGNVSGWCDLQDQSYSKSEANGTFVATANIDSTTLSGDGKSVSTKLGVKTDVIATRDYVNSSFLPTSGGTVSGELVVSAATGTFDNSYVKCVNNGNDGYARFGVGSYGGAVIKAVNGNNNVQVNVKYNANNNELIQVQKSNTDIGYLIPAQIHQGSYTPTSDDGILHIVLES